MGNLEHLNTYGRLGKMFYGRRLAALGTQHVFNGSLSAYQIDINGGSLLPNGPKYSEHASPHLNPPIEVHM